jgi:hypothetical protein
MDWQIKMTHGQPDISVCKETETCLHLKSVKSSFALEHSVDVDPAQMPFLTWHWKVAQLPGGGDFRRASLDDQAAQVLVAFSDKHILTYIWGHQRAQGNHAVRATFRLVHIFAVARQSGAAEPTGGSRRAATSPPIMNAPTTGPRRE